MEANCLCSVFLDLPIVRCSHFVNLSFSFMQLDFYFFFENELILKKTADLVQPEADPRDDDEHAAWHVDGDQVVRKLALEDKLNL